MYHNLVRIPLLVAAIAMILAACGAPAATAVPTVRTDEATAVTTLPLAHTACADGVDLTGQTVSLHHMLALVGEQNDTFLQPLKAGFDDATEYFNEHGGICGAALTQVFADTDMSIQEIYTHSIALESKPVLVTLYGSGDAEDLRDQLASDEIPGLGIRVGSVKALYGEDGQTPGWIFGTNPLYVDQIGSICDYIAANPDLFPKPVLGFINWDEAFARSADTDEARAYCQSVGVGYAGASYFSGDATYIQPHIQNLIDAGATILFTQSLDTGPVLVAKTIDEMGLQGKVTLAAVNWAMDPTVGLLGGENIRADGLPAMSGMIGSLPLRSWAETDHPGIQLMIEQADLHQRPAQVRNHYYTLAWASTDLYIEVYIQTGNRVGFDNITGADIKETLENIVYSPLGGVENIDFEGGARRTLSANRIGEMNYLGQDGKTAAGENNPLLLSTVGGEQHVVPMLMPLSDFQTAPDLRPGGTGVPAAISIAPTNTSELTATQVVLGVFEGTIAFRSHRDSSADEIWVMNGDGSGLLRLTKNSYDDDLPAWSPDGTRIAFCSLRDGNWEVYVMNADGSDQANLSENSLGDCAPSWSPDGTEIAFDTDRDSQMDIYVMNADGSDQTRLTDNPALDIMPDWSPDGKRIVFVSDRDGQMDIYVMNVDGGDVTRLTDIGVGDAFPAWSPDGTKIAFGSNGDGKYEIYVMNADGSGQTKLTNNSANDWHPSWSPEGTQITFSSERDGNAEIYFMNADGSGQMRLTDNPADDEISIWQP
jgi:Tol biopolymer transport system component/ABC-type branched-subunit amino acid transport system substrate-binding protein